MTPSRRHIVKAIAAIPVAPLLARGEAVAVPIAAAPVMVPAASCCSCAIPTSAKVTISGMGPLDGCYDWLPWFVSADGRGGYMLDLSQLTPLLSPRAPG